MPRTPSNARTNSPALRLSEVFGARLRQARELAGISQETLATNAGIDEFSASARISQYETGKHAPRYETACRLAKVLNVPVPFLYCPDEPTAQLLLDWNTAPAGRRQRVTKILKEQD